MIWQTLSTGSAETERLGELLGSHLTGGEVIELRSDLGGGKTTFVKGLVRGAGSRATVSSPTFTLSRIYPGSRFDIHHFDFYRLADPGIMATQLAESVSDSKSICVIEWADTVADVLPENRLAVEFTPSSHSSDERQITVNYPPGMRQLITELETAWQEVEP